MSDKIIIYRSAAGEASLDVCPDHETFWLNQK